MTRLTLSIEPDLCGPVSMGTVSVIKLLARTLDIPLAEATTLVSRCVFDGETVSLVAPSRAAAARCVQAIAELPAVPRAVVALVD